MGLGAQAMFVELPFAIFLLYVVVRVVSFTRGTVWSDQVGSRPKSLWSVEFAHPSEVDGRPAPSDSISPRGRGQPD